MEAKMQNLHFYINHILNAPSLNFMLWKNSLYSIMSLLLMINGISTWHLCMHWQSYIMKSNLLLQTNTSHVLNSTVPSYCHMVTMHKMLNISILFLPVRAEPGFQWEGRESAPCCRCWSLPQLILPCHQLYQVLAREVRAKSTQTIFLGLSTQLNHFSKPVGQCWFLCGLIRLKNEIYTDGEPVFFPDHWTC